MVPHRRRREESTVDIHPRRSRRGTAPYTPRSLGLVYATTSGHIVRCMNFHGTSNYEIPLKVDRDQRRYVFFDVSDHKKGDFAYFEQTPPTKTASARTKTETRRGSIRTENGFLKTRSRDLRHNIKLERLLNKPTFVPPTLFAAARCYDISCPTTALYLALYTG